MNAISALLTKLGYVKGQPLTFLSKRVCGMWLIWASAVILIGTIFGGKQKINMLIFDVGYFLGFALVLLNKRVYNRLAFGSQSKFQKNMTNASIILMFILLVGFGGPYFDTQNYRMIWLGAFLAVGIHFIPFAAVHGKMMLPLALLVSVNAIVGMLFQTVNFAVFAYVDVGIKVLFGIILLFSKNPLSPNNVESRTQSF